MTNDYDLPAPGRPRDPTLDGRILRAAVDVYAGHGWSGFTVKAVAAAAGASRDAVGRRFETREELLMEALSAAGFPMLDIRDGQSLRDWLLELAVAVFDTFTHENGRAYLRIHLDADSVPGLFAAYRHRLLEPAQLVLRDRISATARAENYPSLDPGAVIEDVLGPTFMLAMLNQDITDAGQGHLTAVAQRLPAIVERALSHYRPGTSNTTPPLPQQ
ncbi:TetR family transcriptional regulator [Nocardia sp. alder85J]|uniref:TetR family transcriptional regulator n=1 Tax=Nocardia sp. alder85J TaxID=2862949 RepID=UPI001CD78513|nr:TetR family transcriptional regulator [Nocardia sp. alder85J]MCX4098607.1 TetR family transcriptional regulator [Nocardia sp. alder85J]